MILILRLLRSQLFPPMRTFEGVAPGDILRICEVGGVYALENNATCGGVTTNGAKALRTRPGWWRVLLAGNFDK